MSYSEEENPFADAFDDEMVAKPISVFADIKLVRVINRGSLGRPSDGEVIRIFNELQRDTARFANLEVPGKEKYADRLGGAAAMEALAKEGGSYNWLEAFAAAEAHRIGVIRLRLPPLPRVVGAADVEDVQGRPFDVKTPSPTNTFTGVSVKSSKVGVAKDPQKFSTKHALFERIQSKGGYDSYPAVLILDTAFLSTGNRALLLSKIAKYVGRGMAAWRIIEVSPDYFNIGFCTYAMSSQPPA